ncbi:MAG: hypothetical protein WBO92_03195 [Candidatus Moraniibacteriota bacterium]
MKWKIPPPIKIYEALGAIGDDRIRMDGDQAKVYSSSGQKFYSVTFDPDQMAIMTNDNGSYWQGYLGYPAVAFLCLKGIIHYDTALADALAGIAWKDINVRFKNDFAKTEALIHGQLSSAGWDVAAVRDMVRQILSQIEKLSFNHLGQKTKPPTGY